MKRFAWMLAGIALASSPAIAQIIPLPTTIAELERSVPTPYVIGAIRFKPEELTVAAGPVRRGQPMLSGVAEHASTAATTQRMIISHSLFVKEDIPVGAVLHAAEFVDTSQETPLVYRTWCSDFGKRGFIGPGAVFCFLEGDPLHRTWVGDTANAWISVSPMFPSQLPGRADVFAIEPSETDLIGPMDIRFEIVRIRRENLRVILKARRNRQDMTVFIVDLPLTDGVAVLPLWSHTMSMTVNDEMVTPTLQANGDGSGPTMLPGVTFPIDL